MQLVKEEWKKLWKSKKIFIVIGMLIITIIAILSDYITFRNMVGNINDYNKMANGYEGILDVELADFFAEQLSSIQTRDGELNNAKNYETVERAKIYFMSDYVMAVENAESWKKIEGESLEYPSSVSGIEKALEKMEEGGDKQSYSYQSLSKQYSMLKQVEEPNKYYNAHGILKISNMFMRGFVPLISIGTVLVLLVSTIFSDEYIHNMNSTILTSLKGRKSIVKAKMLVSDFLTIFWISIYYWGVILLILSLYENFSKLDIPLNCIMGNTMSPYGMSVKQWMVWGYVAYLIGGLVLSGILTYISIKFKNSIICIAVGFVFLILPLFLPQSGKFSAVTMLFPSISMQGGIVFSQYYDYNLFGKSIIYPIVIVGISLFVFVMLRFILLRTYLKTNIR